MPLNAGDRYSIASGAAVKFGSVSCTIRYASQPAVSTSLNAVSDMHASPRSPCLRLLHGQLRLYLDACCRWCRYRLLRQSCPVGCNRAVQAAIASTLHIATAFGQAWMIKVHACRWRPTLSQHQTDLVSLPRARLRCSFSLLCLHNVTLSSLMLRCQFHPLLH